MSISFKNCKYQWQLQETLKKESDSFRFEKPQEYDSVAQILLLNITQEKERATLLDQLNPSLKSDLETFLNYVDAPLENISVQFVNDHRNLFGIKEVATQKQVIDAYSEMVVDIFKEIAEELQAKPQADRNKEIAKKHELDAKKKIEQQELQRRVAPVPGSANSTNQLLLTRIVGGGQKLNEITALFKQESTISGCTLISDTLSGVFTDEEGLRWNFEMVGESADKLIVFVKNYDALYLSTQDPTKALPANSAFLYNILPPNTFPKGQIQFDSATIKSILMTKMKELTYLAFCSALGKANDIDEQSISRKIDEIISERNYIPRAEIRRTILELTPPPPMDDALTSILAQLFGPDVQLRVFRPHDDNPASGAPGIFPGLATFMSANRYPFSMPTAGAGLDDDNDEDEDEVQTVGAGAAAAAVPGEAAFTVSRSATSAAEADTSQTPSSLRRSPRFQGGGPAKQRKI